MGEDKGEELMDKADKRLKSGFSFFSGSAKFEDAAEMYTKAGNSFKITKKCMYNSHIMRKWKINNTITHSQYYYLSKRK